MGEIMENKKPQKNIADANEPSAKRDPQQSEKRGSMALEDETPDDAINAISLDITPSKNEPNTNQTVQESKEMTKKERGSLIMWDKQKRHSTNKFQEPENKQDKVQDERLESFKSFSNELGQRKAEQQKQENLKQPEHVVQKRDPKEVKSIDDKIAKRCKDHDESKEVATKKVLRSTFESSINTGIYKAYDRDQQNNKIGTYKYTWSKNDSHCTVKDSHSPDANVLLDADVTKAGTTYYPNGEAGTKVALNTVLASSIHSIDVKGGPDKERFEILLMAKTHPEFKDVIQVSDKSFEGFTDPLIKEQVAALKNGTYGDDATKYETKEKEAAQDSELDPDYQPPRP